jgi:hypothetical protein
MPVNVTGVQATLKDMRKFDPDLAKQMNKQIKTAMMPILEKSKAYAPANSKCLAAGLKQMLSAHSLENTGLSLNTISQRL